MREQLGITLAQQTGWGTLEEAFEAWRIAVEAAGVFVFKRSFKQKKASGFFLYDERFPVIYINNSSSWSRQIFTLFHEIAHLLYGASGVTSSGESYLGALDTADREIEVACNRFAGVLLVPYADSEARSDVMTGTEEEVENLAEHYCVSREVVLRKFYDRGRDEQNDYRARASRYHDEYQAARESSATGGDYYRNQSVYLSRRYSELALARFHEGRVSLGELAGHLGIKARNIERFESDLWLTPPNVHNSTAR